MYKHHRCIALEGVKDPKVITSVEEFETYCEKHKVKVDKPYVSNLKTYFTFSHSKPVILVPKDADEKYASELGTLLSEGDLAKLK